MSVKKDFSGKVVLITGSSSGIGAETAKEFSKAGAQVVITGRNAENLSEVGKQCSNLSPKSLKPLEVLADVSNEVDCKRLVDQTIEHFGKLDVLVNNAGRGGNFPVEDPNNLKTFDELIKLNLRSVVQLTQLASKYLEKTKGSIVNISSTVALKPYANMSVYCVTKAALDMFTRVSALELGPKGIRVNVINPAAVRTNFGTAMGFDKNTLDKILDSIEPSYPIGRLGQPIDIANVILFLASDDCSWVTGTNFLSDGGVLNAPNKPVDMK